MVPLPNEMGLARRKSRVVLGHIKFEIPVRHPCGDIKKL